MVLMCSIIILVKCDIVVKRSDYALFNKRTKIYASPKKYRIFLPMILVLVLSLSAAIAGTLYWDRLQKKELSDPTSITSNQAEVPKEVAEAPKQQLELNPIQPPITTDPLDAEKTNPTDDLTQPDTTEQKEDVPASKPTSTEPITSKSLVPESPPVEDTYFADVAFVGDSITEGIALYSSVKTNVVASKGINLDTIYKEDAIRTPDGYVSVLTRLSQIKPKKIYILFGSNGVGWFTPEHFSKRYSEFVDKIVAQHPDSQVYLQSITPVTQKYSDTPKNNIDNNKINDYNKLIVSIAEEKGVYYLDIAFILRGADGALPDEVSGDGMHFSLDCYNKWFDYLKSHVATEE